MNGRDDAGYDPDGGGELLKRFHDLRLDDDRQAQRKGRRRFFKKMKKYQKNEHCKKTKKLYSSMNNDFTSIAEQNKGAKNIESYDQLKEGPKNTVKPSGQRTVRQ